jgi:amino acid adenylation domain-containing protein/non-ribosomal peptide synthase protein (TIGR01720 family)
VKATAAKAQQIEDVYELSPLQQGMLYHCLRAPASNMYFHQIAYTLQGDLDLLAFQNAWQRVVDRHPVLRTSFHWENLDKPRQVVHRRASLPLEQLDWHGLDPTEQEGRLQAYLQADQQRGFVLTQPPLVRLALIRTGDDTYEYIWSQHHILWDGWSGPLILKEFVAFYEAFRQGRELILEPPRPFRDYIAWLRRQDLGKAEAFWRRNLKGFVAPTPLVIDRLGTGRPTADDHPEEERLHFSREVTAGLQALARQNQVTLNTVIQGAWVLLLGRYSGLDDVVFGTSVSGRPAELPGVEQMVGLFINTLPVRVRLPLDQPVQVWLKQLQAEQAELRQYEYSPLVQVHGWSEVPRGMPLFESMMVFVNYATDRTFHQRLGNLEVRKVRQAVQQTDCPLGIVVIPGEELALRLVYAANRFERTAMTRLLQHLQAILTSMAANPRQHLGEVPLMGEAERGQVLVEWNDTAADFPRDRCVHELFEEQVKQRPDAVAVVFQGQSLTYAELDRRANQLAHYLHGLGVGLESCVALRMDRCLEMVIGILGVLKAGAAYVPLDFKAPRDRLAYMLQSAEVKAVLIQETMRSVLPECSAPILALDSGWAAIAEAPADTPCSGVGPDNLAYLIYTSGSTGQPKGVLVPHRGLTNIVCVQIRVLGFGPQTRGLQYVYPHFDAAQPEFFRALAAGAMLFLAVADDLLPGPSAVRLLRDLGITLVTQPSSVMAAQPTDIEVPALHTIIVGGEVCPPETVMHWSKGRRFFNGYGPTETTVCSTMASNWDVTRPPPIGKPVANSQVYVLDHRFQPLPIGVPGELYIAGVGVTRGYLHQPDLTAARFLPNPFSKQPGARMYWTGDLACWRPDGNLEFLGRVDEQVKIRGFRIELGEIETVLGQHPGLKECAVLAREGATPNDRSLVAYVVARQEPTPKISDLRSFLHNKLLDYMVPPVFVFMTKLPRMANGKVDRKALPAPDSNRPEVCDAYVAPRTPAEELVAGIWADVLRVPRVGAFDNFFDLGGHSLMATQLTSKLRSAFGVEVPLRVLFETPSVAALTEFIDKTRRQAAQEEEAPPLQVVGRDGNLALSFAQQRLWFFDQLEPDSLFYSLPTAIRLSGALDVVALERSLREIVRRHEVLRTTFTNRNGQPVQVIAPPVTLTLPVVDLSGLAESDRETQARKLANEEAHKPLDLALGPLVRTTLLRLGTDEHVLLLTMHHIVSDGWSMTIFFRELGTLYEAFANGKPSPLPDLSIQYADFAAWQRQWLQGAVLEQQLAYWKKVLDRVTPLELPTDRPRPADQRFTGAHETIQLPLALKEKLEALSRQEGATLFMTLLAAFQVLLSRYTGQEDIGVGTPIAGRNRSELEGMIGFFVNTLVMRTDLSGDPSFRKLLGRMRSTCLGAYDHQDVPFEKLVEELQPDRELGRNPLFQVLFVLQNAPRTERKLQGLTLSRLNADFEPPAKFDLTLGMAENDTGLRTTLKCNAELYDAETMRRMLQHFQTLLEGIVAHPEQALSRLPVLPESEKRQLLIEWNQTAADYPRDRCVHQLIEAQARQKPDAVALTFQGQTMTYRELDRRANRLANHLRGLGVSLEDRVALCLDRSLQMIVGMLGVLKAGAAYIPLDATHPAERLAYIIKDAEARVVLTQQHLRERLSAQGIPHMPCADHTAICLDGDWPTIAPESDEAPASAVTPANLAYIIYTSGSTGQPKGVLVEHRGLTNVICSQIRQMGVRPDTRALQFVHLHFDAAQGEIYRILCAGATLCLAPAEALLPGPAFAGLLREQRITLASLPPSFLAALPGEDQLPNVRTLVVGGEAIMPEVAVRWSKGRLLCNGYGPTETTIGSTLAAGSNLTGAPTLGKPIANTQVYVLDRRLQPAPIGVPGELCIGGAGVTRGYLHQPELTAARFIANPFSTEPGTRLYQTGDRVRWLPDGTLEFLGRVDEQVKIRGYRIELGEIEAVLSKHPGLRDSAVMAREDTPGNKRLVAYVVAKEEPAPPPSELRGFLESTLPEYMVPSVFVYLPVLPRMAQGKVDRQALPKPATDRPDLDDAFVAPRTPVEEMVAGVWADILKLDRVGAADNFFELGGHSLLATQVVSRLRSAFGVEVPLRALFETPTVAGLAEAIDKAHHEAQGVQVPPIRPVSRDGELPLSFAQQRVWFFDQLEPGNLFYTIPTAIRMNGVLYIPALEKALGEILRRHEVLRTTFGCRDGQAMQIIAPARPVTLPVEDLTHLPEGERETQAKELASQEAKQPFNLAEGPLVRGSLLRLGAEDHVLLLTMHHIVSDGWSMTIFFRELTVLYEAFAAGKPSPLLELSIQYADVAVWQRNWLQGEVLDQQLAYWRNQLGGVSPLELPTDKPRSTAHSFHGANEQVRLPHALADKLQALGRQEGATLFMTLLAAFQVLLSRYSGQDDFAVGTPIAGRNRSELEGLIGFFVNTLVLRADLSGNPTFRHLLGRVREGSLGAYAHQDVPFEKLVDELHPERDLSRNPLFQVLFVLQNVPRTTRELQGLTLSRLGQEVEATAKFDLTLGMTETEHGLGAVLKYNAELFEASTIRRMLEHLQTLLEGIAADPNRPVADLPLSNPAETELMLRTWNATASEFPHETCAHQLFEEQVERTPGAVAVAYEGRELTYRELNQRANRLAHRLRTLGVGPEVVVGLCLERSLDMIVGILGIFKAGGVHLPVDPVFPADRQAFLLEDANVRVLVTQERLLAGLPPHTAQVVCVDRDAEALDQESDASPVSGVGTEHLAYLIYTSGSTGKPKGVMVEHRSLTNLVSVQKRLFELRPESRSMQFGSLNFDISLGEVFRTLAAGGRLCMAGPEAVGPGPGMLRFLQEQEVTHFMIPPSLLTPLPAIKLPALQVIMVGGDTLAPELIARWAPGRRFFNGYGPTETTVCSTVARCADGKRKPTIGTPVANTQIYLLDAYLKPVPLGVPGEMYIGGAGLARGYLNRPDQTAAAFVPNPFSAGPGARLYKTGDLARWLPDGNLDFLGRVDYQVKIRGIRVEVGEIENVLGQHPNVKENVVVAREDTGSRRLVAYLVARQEPAPSIAEVRAFLKTQLPESILPTAFVFLPVLPRTGTGKVDRKLLPAPDASQPEVEKAYVAPRGKTEELLAGIWSAVLKRAKVGVHHNFFELGGDSILSIQIIARANQAGLRLTAKDLFQHQTIAELAQVAEAAGLVPAEQGLVTGPVALTPIQHWFFEQDQPERHHHNQALLLEVKQGMDLSLLERAVGHVLEHHDALRLRFVQDPAGWQQFNAGQEAIEGTFVKVDLSLVGQAALPVQQARDRQGCLSYEQVDLAGVAEAEQCRAVEEEAAKLQAGLHLTDGPVARVAFFDLGPGKPGRLLVILHQLVADTMSLRLVLEDLLMAYQQLRRGQDVQLPPKTTSFQQWAQRLVAQSRSEDVQAAMAYWTDPLRAEMGRLPVDQAAGENTRESADTVVVTFGEEETKALLDEVNEAYRTETSDLLLTALLQAMEGWTGQSALLVDLETEGREEGDDVDLGRTVGWFATRYPVRLDVGQAPGPGQALTTIKEQLRQVPKGSLGYGLLRYLNGDEAVVGQLRALPAAEIAFRFLGAVKEQLPKVGPLAPASEWPGTTQSQRGKRAHLLEVCCRIAGGQLHAEFTYSANVHDRATIENLAEDFAESLQALIAHCQSPEAGGFTASDFPGAQLSQAALSQFLSQISAGGEEDEP